MSMLALGLLAGLLLLAAALFVMSPGEPAPIVDAAGQPVPGSLAEKVFLDVHGVRQGMFIKSRDPSHPVLLYLHGGMPDYFLTRPFPTGLEDQFTVVWWEQRGSGISYSPHIPRETMTLEQLVADTLEVANHLRRRFGKEKIYLMGHSGGTFVGIQAVARAPELFHAYIGVAQMSYQAESERLAWEYMRATYEAAGNERMARRLAATPVTIEGGTPKEYLAIRDVAMHELGIGTMHRMRSLLTGLVFPSFAFREYTLGEKLHLWTAKSRAGVSVVWNEMVATDLRARLREVKTPVYFLHDVHDYTVSYALARSYLAQLQAPVKGFYTFRDSAHSPMFEEPERVNRILREDVLQGRTSLADGPGE
jgi:pimeloyl-ACP methyl ester carboxylesterase